GTLSALEIDSFVLQELIGYRLVWAGHVTGYFDTNNRDKTGSWAFEGCDWDRKIFLDDRYEVVCQGYGYTYAYHPEAALFDNGSSRKLLVQGRLFSVR
ncbi:MAG: hypothetical protein ACI4SY_05885, partial [Sutterella sp.]